MLGEIDSFDFVLAADLGMSLADVRALNEAEFVEWRAFYLYRSEMERLRGG